MSEDKKDIALIGVDSEKPAQVHDRIEFPFPEPTDTDFDEDISEDEREYYKSKYKELSSITNLRLHCSACDRHLGCSAKNENRMHSHPMLRTLVCRTCHTFYNSGEFDKGDDGSELYCRWCGQGGQVYCCANCPHVFCAKCIKRNLGPGKIKDIENTDDWKCFKCNSRCLWDLRAMCWALLRYVDLKNKITYKEEDAKLKETYQKDCTVDYSDCCKSKAVRNRVKVEPKKKEKVVKEDPAKTASNIITKIPPSIQVKKFASIYLHDSSTPKDKKPQKRPASPKTKTHTFNSPITISQPPRMLTPITSPMMKKLRLPNVVTPITPIRIPEKRGANTYRPRPRPPNIIYPQPNNNMFNGYNNMFHNINNIPAPSDNINLSLDSLTQGLDMNAVAAMSNMNNNDDDVVCTPDFPMEPLCEVTEDNPDDDVVECITPAQPLQPQLPSQQMLQSKNNSTLRKLPELCSENIIQMTENDVTVNTVTGGLKFRVDPQTLSANKMYRLPDGRIFAINPNPSMPGGYSATIVAVTEASGKKMSTKGTTFAAKLSTVPSGSNVVPPLRKLTNNSRKQHKKVNLKEVKELPTIVQKQRDLRTPVEWFRFNLIDAVDCLDYSLTRLNKLKKDTSKPDFLRTRSVEEMKELHKTLDRLLSTSMHRFDEIKCELNKSFKNYLSMKAVVCSDDDDDVEILPNAVEGPIFIDENSCESVNNTNQEVDLTGVASDLNDSGEKLSDTESGIPTKRPRKNDSDSMYCNETNILDETDSLKESEINEDDKNDDACGIDVDNDKSNDPMDNEKTNNAIDNEKTNDAIDKEKTIVSNDDGKSNDAINNGKSNDAIDNGKSNDAIDNGKSNDAIKADLMTDDKDSDIENCSEDGDKNNSGNEKNEVNDIDMRDNADDDKDMETSNSKEDLTESSNEDIIQEPKEPDAHEKEADKETHVKDDDKTNKITENDSNEEMSTEDIPDLDKTDKVNIESDENKSIEDNEKNDIRDEMSDEMIDSLLKDDGMTDDANMQSLNSFDISEVV